MLLAGRVYHFDFRNDLQKATKKAKIGQCPNGDETRAIEIGDSNWNTTEDCNAGPSFPLFPSVSLISVIGVIRGCRNIRPLAGRSAHR
jgi:hypothetical protein